MKYILKNIRDLVYSEKIVFSIMIICVFTSAFILNFSYGLFTNYNNKLSDENISLRQLPVKADLKLNKANFQHFIESIPPETQKTIDMIYAIAETENEEGRNFQATLQIVFRNGKYGLSNKAKAGHDAWRDIIIDKDIGRYFTNEEMSEGCYVALGAYLIPEHTVGNKIELFGNEYSIIGLTYSSVPIVPFLTVPQNAHLKQIVFITDKPLSRKVYNAIRDTAEQEIPGMIIFPELKLPDDDILAFYSNMILISILISVLSVLNFSMLYLFIIKKRRKCLAVFRICGASYLMVMKIYLGECFFITIPVFILGTACFDLILRNFFIKIYPYMSEVFDFLTYFVFFLTYLAVMGIILSIVIYKNIKENICESMTGGRI